MGTTPAPVSRSHRAAARLFEREGAPVGAAFAATVLWSMGNLLAAGADLPGAQLAFWRVTFGAIAYQAVFALRGGRMRWATLRTSAMGGVAFGLSAALFFSALQSTTVASATVIAALQPVLLLPYAARRLGERVDGAKMALVALAVVGTVVVVLGSSAGGGDWSLWGDLLALGGTVVGCAYFVGTKQARETLGTLEYQAAAMTIGAVVALGGALVSGPGLARPSGADLGTALLMMLVPGSGHLLMSWAQKHLEVGMVATIALDVVVLSSLGAALVHDQPVGAVQVFGMVLVVVALALFVRRESPGAVVDPAEVPVVPGE